MKKILIKIVTCLSIISINNTMYSTRIYCFAAPSHQILLDDWFLPSLKDDYEVVIKRSSDVCKSAQFKESGWSEAMLEKVNLIIDAIYANWGEVFIYSDVDIQFFNATWPTISKIMETYDFAIQNNFPPNRKHAEPTPGFFACRANQVMLDLWRAVRHEMVSQADGIMLDDQEAIGRVFKQQEFNNTLRWCYLPGTFMSGVSTGRLWAPDQKTFRYLPGIILHHANWTIGLENKIEQLRYVRNEVQKNITRN